MQLTARVVSIVFLVSVGAVLLSSSISSSPAYAAVLDPSTVKSATLRNGLVLVVCEDTAASVVSIEIVVRVGSADEPAEIAGVAHLLEHLCWVGAGGSDPRTAIEEVGGVTNAGTLRDYTRFYATVPASDFRLALRSLAEMVARRDFEQVAIDRERAIILEEVAVRRDQPRVLMNDLTFEELFGENHPYGRPIEGSERSLSRIDESKLIAFHHNWYVPNNMAVVIAGNIDFETALRDVTAAFGGMLPQATPPRQRPTVARPAEGKERTAPTVHNQAYVAAAFVGPAASERKEVCASDLLATLLVKGSFGRLPTELLERRRLVKSAGVDFLTQRDRAAFAVWAICEEDKIPEVKEAICAELRRLAAEPISPRELTTAKRLMYAEYAFANETPSDRAATLAFYEAIDSYRAGTWYLARLNALTSADIMKVASWFTSAPVWIVLRPYGAVP